MENPVDAVSSLVSGGRALTTPPSGGSGLPSVPPPEPASSPVDTVDISPAAIQAARSKQAALPRKPVAAREPAEDSRQKETSGSEVSFNFNKDLGLMTKQIVNSQTGKVEREIPPEALVKLRARIQEAVNNFKSQHGRSASGGIAKGAEADGASEEAA
jgi:hypothetical protein